MAVVALVFGIISIVLSFCGYGSFVGLVLGIVGIILAAKARKAEPSGVATAGLVLCIIGTVLSGILAVACVICAGCIGAAANDAEAMNDLANALSELE